jgi:hypothetical protein
MLKRILGLALLAAVGWLIWVRLRRRQDELTITTPQFAPPHAFAPPTPSAHPPGLDVNPAAAPPATPAAPASGATSNLATEAPAAGAAAEEEITGYCMRCKTKRPIQNARRETTESGRPAARGVCSICGANMFTFLATNDDT